MVFSETDMVGPEKGENGALYGPGLPLLVPLGGETLKKYPSGVAMVFTHDLSRDRIHRTSYEVM